MHPAKSVIFFTTASGAGYGLIVWLAVSSIFGLTPEDRTFSLVAFGAAMTLIVAGLLSSTFHLGHPERAWRALSQWRSSWLSREGVAAIAAFAPIGSFALLCVFGGMSDDVVAFIGGVSAIAAMTTVYCTAMIYASLKAIPAWHNGWTPVVYLVFSLMTGSVLAAFLLALWRFEAATPVSIAALFLLSLSLIAKAAYWRSINHGSPVGTSGTATGLAPFGKVNLVDAPHTESNYLLEEMGFKIARKHADKLRQIVVVAGFVAPFALIAVSLMLNAGALKAFVLGFATATCCVGVIVERWLFFAEAKHVVTLYYGEQQI